MRTRLSALPVLLTLIFSFILTSGSLAAPAKLLDFCLVNERLAIREADWRKVPKEDQNAVGNLLAALNEDKGLWQVYNHKLIIDVEKLRSVVEASAVLTDEAKEEVLGLAYSVHGKTIKTRTRQGAVVDPVFALGYQDYYDDVLVSRTSWNSTAEWAEGDWSCGGIYGGQLSVNRSVTLSVSVSVGPASESISQVLSSLGVDINYTKPVTYTNTWNIPPGQDCTVHVTEPRSNSNATYDEFYYTCPDVPGEYVCYYLGRYAASSYTPLDRHYSPLYRDCPYL